MSARDALLAEIDAFLARTGMPDTRFGRAALNDPHFLRRLRSGGDTTLTTADRLRAFMRTTSKPPGAAESRAA